MDLIVSDIAVFVLKTDIKLQPTNQMDLNFGRAWFGTV